MDVLVRKYRADDLPYVVNLFRDTIHTINAKDYTAEQLNAWAPQHIDAEKWGVKLLEHYTVVAECNGVLCGFADLNDNGYFDHLFTHKDFQGIGIATKIVNAIEAKAREMAVKTISVHVSITARTFFIKQGYKVVAPQEVYYNGEFFTNYIMEKNV